jgi:hypothetical protein
LNDHSVPPQHLPAQLTSFVGRERDRAPLATLVDLVRPQQLLLLLDNHVFRYRSTEDWLYTFRAMYGPMLKAFDGLNASAQERLAGDPAGRGESVQSLWRPPACRARRVSRGHRRHKPNRWPCA